MELNEVIVQQKVKYFFNIATEYIGKEIEINSGSYFIIDEVLPEKQVLGEYNYHIYYSDIKDNMIDIYYIYSSNSNSFCIKDIVFYIIDNKGILRRYNFSNRIEIIKLLDSAIDDLSNAKILGDCLYGNKDNSSTIRLCLNRYL